MNNLKIKPILTEKSLAQVARGEYSFFVPRGLGKSQIKEAINQTFEVNVTAISTLNYKPRTKTNLQRRITRVRGRKKAVVRLRKGETIDLFGENKAKK